MGGHRAGDAELGGFGAQLRALRAQRGLSLKALSELVFYDKGNLSKVERGLLAGTADLARRCDEALQADGRLLALHERANRHTSRPCPAQLPAALQNLVGRSAQLRRMTELAGDEPHPGAVTVIALDGPPGVGKTALALYWAHLNRARVPDGALFADLAGHGPEACPAKPAEVLEGFLRGLGVDASNIPAEEGARAAMYRSLLHGRRMLVVLDNAADSQQVRPLLPGSERCVVIVTSRARLTGLVITDAAVPVTLDPLSPAEAAELVRSIIGPERAAADPQAVVSITQRCGYLPLALRIAAVRLVSQQHRSVTELATDLVAESERLDILTAGDDDTLALRAVFSWSYHALGTDEARLFRLVGLHPGPYFGTEAAAALGDISLGRARRLLARLVAAHLVVPLDSGAFRLLDLLRLYASGLAADVDGPDGHAAAVARLVRWYLHSTNNACRALTPNRPHLALRQADAGIAPRTFTRYAEAAQWCEDELPNLTPVVRLASQAGLHDECWQLAVGLFDFFLLRRPWAVWVDTQLIGIEAARAAGDKLAEAWALTNLGDALRKQGQFAESQERYELALRLGETRPGSFGHSWALTGLGFVAMDCGQYEVAIRRLSTAVMVCRESGYTYGEAVALAGLGETHRGMGDLDSALAIGRQALMLFQSLPDRKAEGYALVRLVRTAREQGAIREAYAYCEGALAANREVGDQWSEAEALQEKGNLLLGDGDRPAARECWLAALDIFEEIDLAKADEVRALLGEA